MILLSHVVANAVDIQGLRARARAKGIADYGCEVGHGKGSRRFIWHVHCQPEVAELLLEEIAAVGKADPSLASDCDRAIADIQKELASPTSYVPAIRSPDNGG
jgi:hypothetical protein